MKRSTSATRIAVAAQLAGVLAIGLAAVLLVAWSAAGQPHLGLQLAPGEHGGLRIAASAGPSSFMPVGMELSTVSGQGDTLPLEHADLVADPGTSFGAFSALSPFFERQERIAQILRSGRVVVESTEGHTFVIAPDVPGRAWTELGATFWTPVAAGFLAWLICGTVFVLRSRAGASSYLLLSGAAALVLATSVALYGTRELALPGGMFRWLSDLGFLGAGLFAAGVLGALLLHPRRIGAVWIAPAIVAFVLVWFGLQQLGVLESVAVARFPLFAAAAAALLATLVQWHTTRGQPVARAALQWFVLCMLAGAAAIAALAVVPPRLGSDPLPTHVLAWMLLVPLCAGLGLGILQYRLFRVARWSAQALVWAVALGLLIGVESALRLGAGLPAAAALALAVVICGLLWLPVRDFVRTRLWGDRKLNRPRIFKHIADVALTPRGVDQDQRWRNLLQDLFDPSQVHTVDPVDAVSLQRDGTALTVPGFGDIAALRLEHARGGRRLFEPADAALAEELLATLRLAAESRKAYDRANTAERHRIARDLHEDVGGKLVTGLHAADAGLRPLFQEALTDVRAIVGTLTGRPVPLSRLLADARYDAARRLYAAGISLQWPFEYGGVVEDIQLDYHRFKALSTAIREAVDYTIGSSRAARVSVDLAVNAQALTLTLRGNGRAPARAAAEGDEPAEPENLRSRLERIGGSLQLDATSSGTRLQLSVPLAEIHVEELAMDRLSEGCEGSR